MLNRAETMFGKRASGWTFEGVELDANGPHLWFPDPLKQCVSIQLGQSVVEYPNQALYQLSHEVVHLLAPNREPPTIMIEEGLAVKFSLEVPSYADGYVSDTMAAMNQNYRDALTLANEVLAIVPDAVPRLRELEPYFHEWTPDFISQKIPELADFADRMCERRQMR